MFVSQSTLSILARKIVVVNTFLNNFAKNVALKKHLWYYRYEVSEMLGEKIKNLRKENKMTQAELSERLNSQFGLNTDRVMISKWETGFQTPIVSTLSCLAQLFGVSLDYLSGTENEEKVQKNNIEAAKVALFSGAGEVTDEMWQEVVEFAKFVEAREAKRNENK